MICYKLSFGTISLLSNNLAEIIADDGIVIDEAMVDGFHDFLLSNLDAPFLLLINKKNSYCYTFEAQKTIISLKEIKAIAVVLGTPGALMSTETLLDMNKNSHCNLQMFNLRDEALNWLENL